VHELVPQDVLMSTNNIVNDDNLDVSMSVTKLRMMKIKEIDLHPFPYALINL